MPHTPAPAGCDLEQGAHGSRLLLVEVRLIQPSAGLRDTSMVHEFHRLSWVVAGPYPPSSFHRQGVMLSARAQSCSPSLAPGLPQKRDWGRKDHREGNPNTLTLLFARFYLK